MSEKPASHDHRWALAACILLALLLVGGTIGAWAYSAHRQRIAVEVLAAVPITILPGGASASGSTGTAYIRGGRSNRAIYDYELDENLASTGSDPPGPAWIRDWLGIDYLATVRAVLIEKLDDRSLLALLDLAGLHSLGISGGAGDDDRLIDMALEALPRSPDLQSLYLSGWPITDDQLHFLPSLTHLQTLDISNCPRITDGSLEQISKIAGLKSLVLRRCGELTDAGLAKLGELKNLESLTIRPSGRASDTLIGALRTLPRLRELEVPYDPDLLAAGGLKHLEEFACLEELVLWGITDESFSVATAPAKLKKLALVDCRQLGPAGLKSLAQFSNLEVLNFELVPLLDDAAMQHIARLPKLRELFITPSPRNRSMTSETLSLTDEGLKSLAGATSLRVLVLFGCPKLTDAGLDHLSALTGLEDLALAATKHGQFSTGAIDKLRSSLPTCNVRWSEPPGSTPPGASP